ncbi:MAG TPA: hypothetical protein VHQ39_12485 [Dongiaceae bacterium]|jgi:hypothetical protein|nr:hypothetical protein [Dongiaceae bacterium]
MNKVNLVLAIAGLMLAACGPIPSDGPPPPPNGSSNAECQHVGGQDTGYVVNCNRHNDEREILH